MSKLNLNHSARIFVMAIFVLAVVAMATTPAFAVGSQNRNGEMKEQGSAAQGDGPANVGDQNQSGDASAGDHREQRGDGIQNGGPIEGKQGKNSPEGGSLSAWLQQILDF